MFGSEKADKRMRDEKSKVLEPRLLTEVAAYLEKYYRAEERGVCAAPVCQAAPMFQDDPKMPEASVLTHKLAEAVPMFQDTPKEVPMRKAAPKAASRMLPPKASVFAERTAADVPMPQMQSGYRAAAPTKATRQLDDMLKCMGESFTQMLLRLIDERGMTDPQVYHKANLDRKLFSKIRKNVHYSPNKRTVIALALALELSVTETDELLKTAGFSLSNSSRADLIVRFSLENEIYDVLQVNEILFHYEEPLLGSG